MARNVLVTGVSGFAGRYMCDYLNGLKPRPNIIGVDVKDTLFESCDSVYKVDLSSVNDVMELFKRSKPDFIIHLAGVFDTGYYHEIHKANVLSIAALLESACQYLPDVVMVAAGSAAEYGRIEPHQLPVDEETLCQPITPYGLSKYLATQIAMYYHRVHNINTTVVRPFQLIGKGLSPLLAPGAFAEQLKQVIAKGSKVIKVGNLESSRDFLDISDAVEAIWALCQKPAPGQIFNLCSGKPTKIADMLDMMIASCGVDINVEVDPSRLRGRADVNTVYGSCEKLRKHCGWQQRTPLEKSVAAMFTD
jgi:GDP-4-dehydro-6-deoxy-D-mannose reductase